MSARLSPPRRFSWAHTRSWWAPLGNPSPEQWDMLFAYLMQEQAKLGCIFVIGLAEEKTPIKRPNEWWVEERLAIGDVSLEQALALPVRGSA